METGTKTFSVGLLFNASCVEGDRFYALEQTTTIRIKDHRLTPPGLYKLGIKNGEEVLEYDYNIKWTSNMIWRAICKSLHFLLFQKNSDFWSLTGYGGVSGTQMLAVKLNVGLLPICNLEDLKTYGEHKLVVLQQLQEIYSYDTCFEPGKQAPAKPRNVIHDWRSGERLFLQDWKSNGFGPINRQNYSLQYCWSNFSLVSPQATVAYMNYCLDRGWDKMTGVLCQILCKQGFLGGKDPKE